MSNDLVTPADLADFPGAPFTDSQVDVAVAELRNLLGWHLAPVRTETITLDHDGGRWLILPSRKVASIAAIRDVSGSTPVALTGWRLSASGYVDGWWPCGVAVVEVDFTHGYTTTPVDVFGAVAALATAGRADANVQSVRIDDFSTTFRGDVSGTGSVARVVTSYGLPREFG